MKQQLYKKAVEFVMINGGNGFGENNLRRYMAPDKDREKPPSINRIYQSILESAQNVQMSPNVIGGAISGEKGNIKPLGEFLFDFSPSKVFDAYGGISAGELLERIIPTLVTQPHQDKRKLWLRYCKTIISAAKFLNQFSGHESFYEFVEGYYAQDRIKPFLPMLLSYEIDGIGFALACDFLKEIGYSQYGKPDTHIKDIFIELNLLNGVQKQSSKADYLSLKLIDEIAELNDVTPYAVDKMLWLVCSGEYYYEKRKIGNKKSEFIAFVRASTR